MSTIPPDELVALTLWGTALDDDESGRHAASAGADLRDVVNAIGVALESASTAQAAVLRHRLGCLALAIGERERACVRAVRADRRGRTGARRSRACYGGPHRHGPHHADAAGGGWHRPLRAGDRARQGGRRRRRHRVVSVQPVGLGDLRRPVRGGDRVARAESRARPAAGPSPPDRPVHHRDRKSSHAAGRPRRGPRTAGPRLPPSWGAARISGETCTASSTSPTCSSAGATSRARSDCTARCWSARWPPRTTPAPFSRSGRSSCSLMLPCRRRGPCPPSSLPLRAMPTR